MSHLYGRSRCFSWDGTFLQTILLRFYFFSTLELFRERALERKEPVWLSRNLQKNPHPFLSRTALYSRYLFLSWNTCSKISLFQYPILNLVHCVYFPEQFGRETIILGFFPSRDSKEERGFYPLRPTSDVQEEGKKDCEANVTFLPFPTWFRVVVVAGVKTLLLSLFLLFLPPFPLGR